MIVREAPDQFRLTVLGYVMTQEQLERHLEATGIWSAEQLARIVAMEVGDTTQLPFAFYELNGVRYASKNGDVDRTKVLC